MRGQGGTKRRCLKAQELISGVGQAMVVGTFGPMDVGSCRPHRSLSCEHSSALPVVVRARHHAA